MMKFVGLECYIRKSNEAKNMLDNCGFRVNSNWNKLLEKLGLPPDAISPLMKEEESFALLKGIDEVLQKKVITWKELVAEVKKIEKTTGDNMEKELSQSDCK